MKKLILLFTLMATFAGCAAAQEILINGYVFTKSDNTYSPVPFASVCYYDSDGNPAYAAFTGADGLYYLGYIKVQDYRIEVSAPGYINKVKKVSGLPESFNGNYTLHLGMQPDSEPASITPTVYRPAEIAPQAVYLSELMANIPGIIYANDEFTTADDGAVKILANGYGLTAENLKEVLESEFPASMIKQLEYYDLTPFGGLYDGVLNMALRQGEQAGAPFNFVPYEVSYEGE